MSRSRSDSSDLRSTTRSASMRMAVSDWLTSPPMLICPKDAVARRRLRVYKAYAQTRVRGGSQLARGDDGLPGLLTGARGGGGRQAGDPRVVGSGLPWRPGPLQPRGAAGGLAVPVPHAVVPP